MTFAICDLCDANEDKLGTPTLVVLPPVFIALGKRQAFCGPARTFKVYEILA